MCYRNRTVVLTPGPVVNEPTTSYRLSYCGRLTNPCLVTLSFVRYCLWEKKKYFPVRYSLHSTPWDFQCAVVSFENQSLWRLCMVISFSASGRADWEWLVRLSQMWQGCRIFCKFRFLCVLAGWCIKLSYCSFSIFQVCSYCSCSKLYCVWWNTAAPPPHTPDMFRQNANQMCY